MPPNIPPIPRRSDRQAAINPIRLVLGAEKFKKDDSATTTDISMDGVGVQTMLPLVPGEWVGYIDKGKFPYVIPTRVVWARLDEYGCWTFAGLEFLPTRTN
jgi:hypothetical protein